MLWQAGKSTVGAMQAYVDARVAGPPTAGPLSVAKIDLLDWWSRELTVVDQVTVIASPVASLPLMTVPAGSVVLSAQITLNTPVAGAIGPPATTKLGIGTTALPHKYGQTTGLAQNSKSNVVAAWSPPLAAAEAMRFFALLADGSAGGTIGPGRIRTLVAYVALTPLPDVPAPPEEPQEPR